MGTLKKRVKPVTGVGDFKWQRMLVKREGAVQLYVSMHLIRTMELCWADDMDNQQLHKIHARCAPYFYFLPDH